MFGLETDKDTNVLGCDLSVEQVVAVPRTDRLSDCFYEIVFSVADEDLASIVGLEAEVVMELIG